MNRQNKLGDIVFRISFLLADGAMHTVTCMCTLRPSVLFYTEQRELIVLYERQKFSFHKLKAASSYFPMERTRIRLGCEEFGVHQKLLWTVDWYKRELAGGKKQLLTNQFLTNT